MDFHGLLIAILGATTEYYLIDRVVLQVVGNSHSKRSLAALGILGDQGPLVGYDRWFLGKGFGHRSIRVVVAWVVGLDLDLVLVSAARLHRHIEESEQAILGRHARGLHALARRSAGRLFRLIHVS